MKFVRYRRRPATFSLVLLLALLVAAIPVAAEDNPPPPGPFKALWIVPPDGPQRDTAVYHFRKEVSFKAIPPTLNVRVTADSNFILYVNGVRVGQGPAKGDLTHWRYESYDLAPLLHAGKNILAAVVWNFGARAAVAQVSSRAAFFLDALDGPKTGVNTDATWQVEADSGHTTVAVNYTKELDGYFAAPPGELLDGLSFDWGWNTATPQSPHFATAAVLATASLRYSSDARSPWALVSDALPTMESRPVSFGKVVDSLNATVVDAQHLTLSIPAHTHATVLVDRGELTTAYPELVTTGGKSASVRITYAEAMLDAQGNKGQRSEFKGRHILGLADTFTTDGGSTRSFSPLEWRTWRFAQLDITTAEQPLQIDRISAQFTAFPFVQRAAFSSSDPELSRMWDVGWLTARLDAHDTYMDTPYWERLQYVGDTRLQALISYTVANDDRLARQAIDAIDNSRVPDGITQSRFPSNITQIIPPFSLLWIGMLHDFWIYRNDPAFVQTHLPGERAVLAFYLRFQQPNSLIGIMPWWNFVDWTDGFSRGIPPQDAQGNSVPLTLQFVAALRQGAELEDKLGDHTLAARYRLAATKAVASIEQKAWNPARGLYADTPEQTHFSEETNAMGVMLKLGTPARRRAIAAKLLTLTASTDTSTSSYYFKFYSARALESAGMGDRYLSLLDPWRKMLAQGLTTWAEKPDPTRSDSHAWSSHPNYDFLTTIAGVRPASPGFATVLIEPHMGALTQVSATFPHPKGNIVLSLDRSMHSVHATITLPTGVPTTFVWKGTTHTLHAGTQSLDLPN